MQVMTDEQRRVLNGRKDGGFVPPPRRSFGDLWLTTVDVLVRILTLGRGRVVETRPGPVHWNGTIK